MTDTSVALSGLMDRPPEEPAAAEAEVLVNMDDVLDGYAVALAHWSSAPGKSPQHRLMAVIGRLRYLPTALALGFVAAIVLNGTGIVGPLSVWMQRLIGLAVPISAIGFYMNAVSTPRQASRKGMAQHLRRSRPGLEGEGISTRIRLTAQSLEVQKDGCRIVLEQGAGGLATETSRGFVVIHPDAIEPIPTRSLDAATTAAIRACLAGWNKPANLGQLPRSRAAWQTGRTFIANFVAFIGVGFLAVIAMSRFAPNEANKPLPSPERVSLVVNDRTLRVAGEVIPIRQGNYTARATSRALHDSLYGHVRTTQARGSYYIERQVNGFAAFSLQAVPRTSWEGPDSVGLIPDDVQVSALPADSVLLEWARSADDSTLQSCAALITYRDALPSSLRAYRRAIRLEFCSSMLTPAALASWMQDAANAVDVTFSSFAQR